MKSKVKLKIVLFSNFQLQDDDLANFSAFILIVTGTVTKPIVKK